MKKLIGIMLTSVATGSAFGSVFDDALIWWRGACDENRDGLITANEVYNAQHPKTDADHQGTVLNGTCSYQAIDEDVVSCWSLVTNRFPVIRQPQNPEDGKVASGNTIKFTLNKTTSLSASTYSMTYFIRFKWDGDFGTLTDTQYAQLLDVTDWYWSRGIKLSMNSNGLRFQVGRRNFDYTTGAGVIEPNVWYDFFVRISDDNPTSTAAHNLSCNFVYFKSTGNRGFNQIWPGSGTDALYIQPSQPQNFFGCRSIELKPTDTISVGNGFKGDIAQFGMWARKISDNELREASAAADMAPTLFTLGRADGSNGEFARSNAVATNTVTLPGSWDFVPPTLNAAFPELNIVFRENGFGVHDSSSGTSSYAYWTTQPHVLVLKTVPGSEEGCVSVILDKGQTGQIKLGRRRLQAGVPEYFYVSALSRTLHTLTIERLEGTVCLDYAQLYGAFCPGAHCYSYYKDAQNQYSGSLIGLALEANTPFLMTGSCKASTDPYDPTVSHTLTFDMSEDFTKIGYTYEVATGQTKGGVAPNAVLYINGVEYGRYTGQWQYSSFEGIQIPAGTFKPGRNEIGWRFDSLKHASDFWMSIRGHYLLPIQNSLPVPSEYHTGLILMVR